MQRLHCNVVAGCDHPNVSKVAQRMSHGKEEKKTANVTAKVDKAVARTTLEERCQRQHGRIGDLGVAKQMGKIERRQTAQAFGVGVVGVAVSTNQIHERIEDIKVGLFEEDKGGIRLLVRACWLRSTQIHQPLVDPGRGEMADAQSDS